MRTWLIAVDADDSDDLSPVPTEVGFDDGDVVQVGESMVGRRVRLAGAADLAEGLFGEDFSDTLERVLFQADDLAWRMQNPEDGTAFDRFAKASERVRAAQEARDETR